MVTEKSYSVMLMILNLKDRKQIHFRFFPGEDEAAIWIDECVAGKYGDLNGDLTE